MNEKNRATPQGAVRTLDTGRTQFASRNGAGIRADEVAEREGRLVGGLDHRLASHCPYFLGAACPLVEIAKGRVKARKLWGWISDLAAVSVGVVLTGVIAYLKF